ncbi:hypothetical protein K438DRAFT_1776158 [Mycena galopus ATCC 62051]|nr:hypothetical protein K438DRAFT_1776158 [Mycena galopus ATCC 62051]
MAGRKDWPASTQRSRQGCGFNGSMQDLVLCLGGQEERKKRRRLGEALTPTRISMSRPDGQHEESPNSIVESQTVCQGSSARTEYAEAKFVAHSVVLAKFIAQSALLPPLQNDTPKKPKAQNKNSLGRAHAPPPARPPPTSTPPPCPPRSPPRSVLLAILLPVFTTLNKSSKIPPPLPTPQLPTTRHKTSPTPQTETKTEKQTVNVKEDINVDALFYFVYLAPKTRDNRIGRPIGYNTLRAGPIRVLIPYPHSTRRRRRKPGMNHDATRSDHVASTYTWPAEAENSAWGTNMDLHPRERGREPRHHPPSKKAEKNPAPPSVEKCYGRPKAQSVSPGPSLCNATRKHSRTRVRIPSMQRRLSSYKETQRNGRDLDLEGTNQRGAHAPHNIRTRKGFAEGLARELAGEYGGDAERDADGLQGGAEGAVADEYEAWTRRHKSAARAYEAIPVSGPRGMARIPVEWTWQQGVSIDRMHGGESERAFFGLEQRMKKSPRSCDPMILVG